MSHSYESHTNTHEAAQLFDQDIKNTELSLLPSEVFQMSPKGAADCMSKARFRLVQVTQSSCPRYDTPQGHTWQDESSC